MDAPFVYYHLGERFGVERNFVVADRYFAEVMKSPLNETNYRYYTFLRMYFLMRSDNMDGKMKLSKAIYSY
jgi:hypothetical protein